MLVHRKKREKLLKYAQPNLLMWFGHLLLQMKMIKFRNPNQVFTKWLLFWNQFPQYNHFFYDVLKQYGWLDHPLIETVSLGSFLEFASFKVTLPASMISVGSPLTLDVNQAPGCRLQAPHLYALPSLSARGSPGDRNWIWPSLAGRLLCGWGTSWRFLTSSDLKP